MYTPTPITAGCAKPKQLTTLLGKIDAFLVKKPLAIAEFPHLNTKAPVAKLDEVANFVNLDLLTILAEQIKDPVRGTVRSWICKNISPDAKSAHIQQLKGLLPDCQCQKLDRLVSETEVQLLCYNEPLVKLDEWNFWKGLPFSSPSLLSPGTFQWNGWTQGCNWNLCQC